jgi:hypothetical protein
MRVEKNTATDAVIFYFDNTSEYAATVDATVQYGRGSSGGWGGEPWEEAVRKARMGDTALVSKAEKLIEQISVDAQRERVSWAPSRGGAYVVVPEALSGYPEPMRRRITVVDDRAPVRIMVDLTSSAVVSTADLVKRGTAILALAMLLNQDRAVELSAVVGLNSGHGAAFAVVRLGQSPLDIAVACNALTSVGFTRQMGYQFLQTREESRSGGEWAWGLAPDQFGGRQKYVEKMRATFGASEKDVIIPAAWVHDEIVQKPVDFVKRSLDEATRVEADAE